jgi:hypothetical protein
LSALGLLKGFAPKGAKPFPFRLQTFLLQTVAILLFRHKLPTIKPMRLFAFVAFATFIGVFPGVVQAQNSASMNSKASWEAARATLIHLCKSAPNQEAELHYKGEVVGHYWLQCPSSFRLRVTKELLPGFLPFELATNSNEAWWARPSLSEADLLAARTLSYHYWDARVYDIPVLLKILDPKMDDASRQEFMNRFKLGQSVVNNKTWVSVEVPGRLVLERIRIAIGLASFRPEAIEIVWPFGLGKMDLEVKNWAAPQSYPPRLFVPKIPLEAKGFKKVPESY